MHTRDLWVIVKTAANCKGICDMVRFFVFWKGSTVLSVPFIIKPIFCCYINIYFLTDFLIGRDIVLAEIEPLSDLLDSLPHKAQFGPKNLMGHVWERTKEHGVKNLFHALRERAQDNFKSLTIEYTCLDVSFDAIVLGTNLGIILLYDRTCRRLSRLPSEVCSTCVFMYNLKLNVN